MGIPRQNLGKRILLIQRKLILLGLHNLVESAPFLSGRRGGIPLHQRAALRLRAGAHKRRRRLLWLLFWPLLPLGALLSLELLQLHILLLLRLFEEDVNVYGLLHDHIVDLTKIRGKLGRSSFG